MKQLLSFLFIFFSTFSYAQKQGNNWYFGEHAGITFNTPSGAPRALTDGKLHTDEGCSTISDKDGNLLFYSDGIKVWDKNHEIMKYSNGRLADDLKGDPSSTQSGLIVPSPTKPNIYFLFTVGTLYRNKKSIYKNIGFNYYTIDMNLNNGFGQIINGPVDLSNGLSLDWSEKISSIQGHNCSSIWVLSIEKNNFNAYKVDNTGVHTTPVKSTINYIPIGTRGYLKISPDGKKVALADYDNQKNNPIPNKRNLVLFDFNDTTGMVSSGQILTNSIKDGVAYGTEFSKNSTKLYVSTYQESTRKNMIFQYDLTASNIPSTKKLIKEQSAYRGALQLGPDGKIYVSIPNKKYLDVIENPDDNSTNVIYKQNAVYLEGGIAKQGLPSFIESFFTPLDIINPNTNKILSEAPQTFCIGNTYNLEPNPILPGVKYVWLKGGKQIGNTPKITIDNSYGSGLYELKVACHNINKSVFINFVNPPKATNITYQQCDVDINPTDGITYFNLKLKQRDLTRNDPNLIATFFKNRTDLITNTNSIAIVDKYTNTKNPDTLFVKVKNKITGCYSTSQIILKVNTTNGLLPYSLVSTPELDQNASNPNAVKSEGTGKGIFDFSLTIDDIIKNSGGTLSLKTHSFEFYTTKLDAILQKNQIKKPYSNYFFVGNSDVFLRISSKTTHFCQSIQKLKVLVKPLPKPQGNETPIILCLNNPIDDPQLLSVNLNADPNTRVQADSYKWVLNGKEILGANQAIYKATKEGIYKVYAIKNYPNAKTPAIGYNTFTVKLSNKPIITKINTIDNVNNSERNQVKIKVSGIGNYEYSITNLNNNRTDYSYENDIFSYTFTKVNPGINIISIRDKNGCGSVKSKKISVIHFQRFFTPNNDGYFDTWKILGVNNSYYTSIFVEIFDRYGQFITILNQNNNGWDGTCKGKEMPPDDYWFKAKLTDKNGNIKTKTGHFSLIRN